MQRMLVLSFIADLMSSATMPSEEQPTTLLRSYLPASGIEEFVVRKLDLSTFRNSLGPRRKPGERIVSDFGLRPQYPASGLVDFREPGWFYQVTILGRGDFNRDGIEDLSLCFTDKSLVGTYQTEQPLLLTRYSNTGLLIAIAYDVGSKSCGKPAQENR